MYARFSVTANLAIFSAGSDSAKHYSTGLTTAASLTLNMGIRQRRRVSGSGHKSLCSAMPTTSARKAEVDEMFTSCRLLIDNRWDFSLRNNSVRE